MGPLDAALFHKPRRRMIRLHDGEMAALDFGDGARPVDVVFAHANGFNAMTYRSILGPLSLSLRILAVDLRGHGASRLPAEPRGRRSWRDLRDDLVALLDVVSDRPVVLAGHSMGATSSLLAGAQRPAGVKALVLFDPVILPRATVLAAKIPGLLDPLWRRARIAQNALRRRAVFETANAAFNAYRGRGAFRTWPEIMLADYVAGAFHDKADGGVELSCTPAWEASNFAAQAHDPWSALRRVAFPIKVFRAGRNSVCHLAPGDRLLRRHPNIDVTTVEGTSHFLPMERADLVRDALFDAVNAKT